MCTWHVQVKQISKEAIVCANDFELDGFGQGLLVIGSYHLVPAASTHNLWMFLGEGDKYSAVHKVHLGNIVWSDLAGSEDLHVGAPQLSFVGLSWLGRESLATDSVETAL